MNQGGTVTHEGGSDKLFLDEVACGLGGNLRHLPSSSTLVIRCPSLAVLILLGNNLTPISSRSILLERREELSDCTYLYSFPGSNGFETYYDGCK